jgi:hypothetical protein
MSPRRRLLLDDGDPSASRADQSAAALHDMSENSSANQQLSCTKTEQADDQRPTYLCKGPAMSWPITCSLAAFFTFAT